MAEKPPVLEFRDVSKSFPDPRGGKPLAAVEGVTFTIPDEEAGEFVVLIGPSGCGKSTILSLAAGMAEPSAGEVLIDGKPVCGPSRLSATVPQAYTCFPWLTALGNVEFGLGLQGGGAAARRKTAAEYLKRVGLGDRLQARP